MRPEEEAEGSAHGARWPAEGSDAAALVVDEELEIEEEALACGEAAEHLLPAALLLVAMREEDVLVLEGVVGGRRVGQLLTLGEPGRTRQVT